MTNNAPLDKSRLMAMLRGWIVAAQDARLSLRVSNDADADVQADALKAEITGWFEQLDTLEGQMMDEWVNSVEGFQQELDAAGAAVQASIKGIEDDVAAAKKAVELIGQIDDVIALAAKVAV